MTEMRLLYTTFESQEDALALGRTLVAESLAACANVMAPMMSVFEWGDEIGTEAEVAMIVKTARDRADAATARIHELHPYEVPCVLEIPVAGGNPAFLDWVAAQTRPPPAG